MKSERRETIEAASKREFQCELHGIPVTIPSAAKYKGRITCGPVAWLLSRGMKRTFPGIN